MVGVGVGEVDVAEELGEGNAEAVDADGLAVGVTLGLVAAEGTHPARPSIAIAATLAQSTECRVSAPEE